MWAFLKRWVSEADLKARLVRYTMPRQEWYRKHYLRSAHWRRTRNAALRRAGYRCRLCNQAGLRFDVHHITYTHLWREHADDLWCVCRECHKVIHGWNS